MPLKANLFVKKLSLELCLISNMLDPTFYKYFLSVK